MAISSKIEEVVYEVSKIAGEVYETLSNSIGSVDTPSSAIFEINNLLNLANSEAPYFSVLETTPASFEITYDSTNPYYVNVSSGQVVYNGNVINIVPQEISIRRSFSQLYSDLYVYGMVIGLPIDEVQKATQAWFTETTSTASIGSTLIYIADSTVPESLGFPLEAQVGRFYLRFVGFNDDKTALLIDPGQNLGTIASPVYGQLQSSITSGSAIRFNYQPRLQSISGFPILTGDGTAMPEDFGYYPPLPTSWLPIGKLLVNNPGDQSVVLNSGEPAIVSTLVALPFNNSSNPIFGDSEDNDRVISACENALTDLSQLKSSTIISDVAQGLKSLSLKLNTTGQTSLRKIWSEQPFRPKSNFSKGLSFTGLERFEFPYSFCQAYFELTNEDLQHTFAIFRGDLVTNNGVTSVSASGTVSAITLGGGPITSTGTLTLSGTVSGLTNSNLSGTAGITNANLATPSLMIGTTNIALGATGSTLAGLTSVAATTFTGALTGNASTATSASISTNLSGGYVIATSIYGTSVNIAGNGASADPYGTIALTQPANSSNYSYYGLTRAASLGAGFGITGTTGALGLGANAYWFGTATAGLAGTMSTAWLAFNGTSLVAVGGITGSAFSGAGTGLTGTATSLSIGGNASTATTAATSSTVTITDTTTGDFRVRALDKAGKSIPSMSDEEKKAFFDKIDAAWNGKGEKNEELVGGQKELDVDGDGDIDSDDYLAARDKAIKRLKVKKSKKVKPVNF